MYGLTHSERLAANLRALKQDASRVCFHARGALRAMWLGFDKIILAALFAALAIISLYSLTGCWQKYPDILREYSPAPAQMSQVWQAGGPGRYVLHVTGTSMYPQVKDGDSACMLRTVGRYIPCIGEVVEVNYSAALPSVLHRVVLVDRMKILTSGDHNKRRDAQWLHVARVKGVLVKVYTLNP